MKVVMIVRATLFSDSGGDTVQIINTANKLRKLGVAVDIKLCTEAINYSAYDLLHLFNIIRPADVLKHIIQSQKPYVISTIFVDYSEYEEKARTGYIGIISKLLTAGQQEYLKLIARRILNNEKIVSPSYLLKGHRNSIKYILKNASVLLPNSESEYNRLMTAFGIKKNYVVIPNGIDDANFKPSDKEKDAKLVLCVSRIEGRKNQLNIIRALNGTSFKLLLLGAPSPNHKSYYNQCRREAKSNVEFIDRIDQQQLVKYYARAKVHVLPSWFETTGLSSLEAAAVGCNIVITGRGDTRDYFGNDAFYCEPNDISSIKAAIEKASNSPTNSSLQNKILSNYTWKNAAEKTKSAYESVPFYAGKMTKQ